MLLDTWGGFFKPLKYKIYLEEEKTPPLPLVAHHCVSVVVVVVVVPILVPINVIVIPIPSPPAPCYPSHL